MLNIHLQPEKAEEEREIIKQRINVNEQKSITNMVSINPIMSIIALHMNGLNIPIKKHIVRLNKRTTQLCTTYKKPTLNIETWIH